MADRAAIIAGLGAYTPPNLVTNDDIAQYIETNDEWIRSRTGIKQRYYVQDSGLSTSDLAAEAGRRALKNAGVDSVSFVIVATSSADRLCPATAPTVVKKIGLGYVPAMDVGAACSGFVYALQTGASMVMSGNAESVLVIGADTPSLIIDDDRNAILFGDGSGAVVLRAGEKDEQGALLAFDSGSDGSLVEAITLRGVGVEHRAYKRENTADDLALRVQGNIVFPHAVRRMAESSRAVLSKTGWLVSDVDVFAGHQANKRIVDSVAELLGVPNERSLLNIQNVGNTSAASIPLVLVESMVEGRLLHAGDRVLLSAFGGGVAWGSATLVWPDLKMPEMYNQPKGENK